MHKHLPVRFVACSDGKPKRERKSYADRTGGTVSAVTNSGDGWEGNRKSHLLCTCPCADRCAPVSNSRPDRKAQNIKVTESENGPYTSAKFSQGRARM